MLSRLEREKLAPSPEASRDTLIRRLSLDLVGLPPSIEEIDAFLADKNPNAALKIGVISDTHGLMRPEALNALGGSDLILHAGDVGSAAVLEALGTIAPVVAVRGNNDTGNWANKLPEMEIIKAGAHSLYMLHNAKDLSVDPVAAGFRVVVSGHSHRPAREERDGVLYLNPGSAGPRRFRLPVAVALLRLYRTRIRVEIVELSV